MGRPQEELDAVMTNWDHTIDYAIADELKRRPNEVFARHPGWDFNGSVWFDGTSWVEEVWCYGRPVKTVSADTLPKLMEKVNDEFGWD